MDITAISDLHGHYPKLEGGDLLIVAGDLTAMDTENQVALFDYWLNEQSYTKKIVIAGNHDNVLAENRIKLQFCEYLCDSGTEFEGLKIWKSPWTRNFEGQNSHCKAFGLDTDEELAEKWALIPDDIDILITHSPPYGILDKIKVEIRRGKDLMLCVGSESLRQHVLQRIKPSWHIFGHIHEWGGKRLDCVTTKFANVSHVNEHYQPVNKPVRIIL